MIKARSGADLPATKALLERFDAVVAGTPYERAAVEQCGPLAEASASLATRSDLTQAEKALELLAASLESYYSSLSSQEDGIRFFRRLVLPMRTALVSAGVAPPPERPAACDREEPPKGDP